MGENRGQEDKVEGSVGERKPVIFVLCYAMSVVAPVEQVSMIELEVLVLGRNMPLAPTDGGFDHVHAHIAASIEVTCQRQGDASYTTTDIQDTRGWL